MPLRGEWASLLSLEHDVMTASVVMASCSWWASFFFWPVARWGGTSWALKVPLSGFLFTSFYSLSTVDVVLEGVHFLPWIPIKWSNSGSCQVTIAAFERDSRQIRIEHMRILDKISGGCRRLKSCQVRQGGWHKWFGNLSVRCWTSLFGIINAEVRFWKAKRYAI